jgi:hypothetical protein
MFSLGNLGGSDVACSTRTIEKGDISIKCPTNSIIDTHNVTYGVMSQFILNQQYCTNNAIKQAIKEKKEKKDLTICTDYIDHSYIQD